MNKKTIWGVAILIVLALGALYMIMQKNSAPNPSATAFILTCESGNTMSVAYAGKDNKTALIAVSGEGYNLDRDISASGAKYTGNDGSIVFWEHSGEAYLEKDGKKIEQGCFVARNDTQ